ncbi:Uncharacterized protein MCB1EB_1526 [Mycoavidus cysteinexigens]|uniref:Uncharacterized protein n=1 Tax=Mycoavidus cysteinexigens TaxID=1553431 RepID=A0A2Z6EW55_9BURK|nr:hypothetical protein [Mycoavidus cysteinexigens]BBE09687.1 Uncharacterized protein MCB1EB_1526 [Mycoavidus cysteinexigens]
MNEWRKEMTTYKYIVDKRWGFEDADCLESSWGEEDAEYVAREVAGNYYSESEGTWEWNESISIQIFKEDGTSLGVFEVGCDLEPQFWVSEEESAQRSSLC